MEIIAINPSIRVASETFATVGFFDGVHRGHRYLIDLLKEKARAKGLKTAVVTFPIHPRKVLQQSYQPKALNTFDERMKHLASTGIDYCYLMEFTKAFSEIPAQDFIQKILSEQLNVKFLLVGYDHRFGKGRESAFEHYAAYGQACGMTVLSAPQWSEAEGHTSSTVIRNLLAEGKVKTAAEKLSYYYTLEGEVVHGNHLGRTIGFPTANIDLNDKDKLIPCEGVYAVRIGLQDESYSGMAYIGKRPTVTNQGELRLEVNIFDFDRDIYGEQLRVELLAFIRSDIRFDGLDKLKHQLAEDKIQCVQNI